MRKIVKIIKKSLPAVVSLLSEEAIVASDLKDLNQESLREVVCGSGFLVSKDGLILTNRHVINDLKKRYLVAFFEEIFPAKILSANPLNDVAILKIEALKNFPFLKLGDSSKVELGETVISIGTALGIFPHSVSKGIISGISRKIRVEVSDQKEARQLDGLIQTDAAINPGNSGGPLINLKGRVIGITTALVYGAENIGFALPINWAKKDLEELRKYGKVGKPILGVEYVLIDASLKKLLNLKFDFGALIVKNPKINLAVLPNTPASKAGLKEGDIILEVDGQKITKNFPLRALLRDKNSVILKVLRDKKIFEVMIKL